ncbi:MAG: hypothetical protein L6U99_05230 [Clostridium sp.]|nr:MAG: hypothetical protein L6U99_05230 [Clostridium sp.]
MVGGFIDYVNNEKNNVRFALYARLSREDESDNDESRSIENQRKKTLMNI